MACRETLLFAKSDSTKVTLDRKVLIILALGISLRLLSFTGLIGSDDLIYNKAAYNITAGQDFALGNPGQNRLGLLLPLAVMFRLWGVNEVSSSLVTLIPSLLLILLTFFAARHFFGSEAGYIAALLQAVYPMDVVYATTLYPDIPVALFSGLGIYTFYRACRSGGNLNLFLSGLCVGLAYSVKMTGAFAAPLLLGYAIYVMRRERKARWEFLWTPLGFISVLGAELLFFHMVKGDMFFRFHSLATHNEGPWSGLSLYLQRGYFARLAYQYPKVMLFYLPHFGLFYWATFAAMAYLLIARERKGYFPTAWWITLFLILNFGSTSFSHYIPLPPVSRYSFVLLLPANIILAGALSRLTRREGLKKWVRAAGYSALAALILSSIFIVSREHRRGSFTERAVSAYFGGKPDKPVYTDSRTIAVLEYYFKYKNLEMVKDFEDAEWSALEGSYVLVNFPRLRFLAKYYGRRFDPILFHPPPSWRRVAIFSPSPGSRGGPLLSRSAILYTVER
jgi:4-amino-4-deoxy-L-arabinose transferase-like glycosyltransferase